MNPTYSPRVVGRERPDFHSLQAFLQFPAFADKNDEAFALSLYDYLAGPIDGLFHFWSPRENDGRPQLRRRVDDPLKLLNVYGWGLCGQSARLLHTIYAVAGFRSRVVNLPGHNVCEVFYDGSWHLLDTDMWAWFRMPDGHIASVDELGSDACNLIVKNTNKSEPCNLPDRTLESFVKMYDGCRAEGGAQRRAWPHWTILGHCMDFVLRPGETLVRSQTGQGRFHAPAEWKGSIEKHGSEWVGYPRERYEPFRSYGNGRWIYDPKLSSDFTDFTDGVWERDGVTQDSKGVMGPGTACFRMQSPYPFCGKPDFNGETVTHRDGVWLSLGGCGRVEVEVTDAEGQWISVAKTQGDFNEKLDFTQLLSSRYTCFVRFTLTDGTLLSSLRFDGYILTAPISLPRLVAGENPMELKSHDKHGLCTVPWSRVVDFREEADLSTQWISAEYGGFEPYVDGWQEIVPAEGKPVRVVFRFDAPASRPFAWCYAHSSLREGPCGEPRKRGVLEWSADGEEWHSLAEREIPNTELQWDCSLDGEVVLPEHTGSLWIRVTSDTPICGFEFHGHVTEPINGDGTLEIVHEWEQDDGPQCFVPSVGAKAYALTCGSSPRGHTITMRVPSRPAVRPSGM